MIVLYDRGTRFNHGLNIKRPKSLKLNKVLYKIVVVVVVVVRSGSKVI